MADLEKIIKKRLGELLVAGGAITQEQLDQALAVKEKEGGLLGDVLVKLGFATETEIVKVVCAQFAKPFIKATQYDIRRDVLALLPPRMLIEHHFVPLDRFADLLVIAMAGIIDSATFADIRRLTGCEVEVLITSSSDLGAMLRRAFPDLFDPITLAPRFESTSALTQGLARTAATQAAETRAAVLEDAEPEPASGAEAEADAAAAASALAEDHSATQELQSISGALDAEGEDSDWEALFEEAEQNVLRTLQGDDSAETPTPRRKDDPPPPKKKGRPA